MKNKHDIKLILLDLGGVLIELGSEIFPADWCHDHQAFGLADWFASATAKRFELGEINTENFLTELATQINPEIPLPEIKRRFEIWPQRLFPGSRELIQKLSIDYTIAVLSNTNDIHEHRLLDEFGLKRMIQHLYFSHRIGLAKPSASSFIYVLNELGFKPSETLFFDDNQDNVSAAKRLGIHAHQVFSPTDIAKFLYEAPNSV